MVDTHIGTATTNTAPGSVHEVTMPSEPRVPIEAYANGNKTIIRYSDGSIETRSGGSKAWRNNNPGNIISGGFANGQGSIGSGAGGFAVFTDEASGYQALIANLNSASYQRLTVGNALARWAPASDNNNPVEYAAHVQTWTGVPATTLMSALNSGQLGSVADAIKRQEGWQVGNVATTPPPRS